MKRYFCFMLFGLLPAFAFSQAPQFSALYFNNGKLRADSTLSISADQFEVWRRAEGNIIGFVHSNISYPAVAHRNGLEGRAVIAFEYKNGDIKSLSVINPAWEGFSDMAIQAFQKATPKILNEFNYWKKNFKFKLNGIYYLPIDFVIFDFREEMKKRNTVPIIKISEPHIGAYGH